VSGRVAVLGGGWAGMAAAVELAAAGVAVTVFEAARTLGGRARRVELDGLALDNGLHILIGAYRETLRLIELAGGAGTTARTLLRRPLELAMGSTFHLRAPRLPAPLHLAAALLRARGLSWRDRLAAAWMMQALRATRYTVAPDLTVSALLDRHSQPAALRRFLWEPLCTAALNTPPQAASAQVFATVLRDSLDGTRADSDLLLPRVDFSALFPEPAAHFVTAHGGAVRTGCAVTRVAPRGAGFEVEAGAIQTFDAVICALPPFRVAQVAGDMPALAPALTAIAALSYEPIWSIYLQYDRAVRLPCPMFGLERGPGQWAFDRGALAGQDGLIGVVISAGGPHEALDQGEVARQVHANLRAHAPGLGEPSWSRVIAERRATFACTPALARPPQITSVPGFCLAGDYTAGDYPATLEAAVRSGVACARALLAVHDASRPRDAA
jgi:squalene-associated FAD-dependent desaturase